MNRGNEGFKFTDRVINRNENRWGTNEKLN